MLSSRTALSSPSSILRVMASSILFLSDLTGAAAAWCVLVENDRIDSGEPVVYWTGREGGEVVHGVEGDRGAGLSAAVKSPAIVTPIEAPVGGGEAWELPASRWMGSKGLTARLLMVCRHEDEITGIFGFLRRNGEAEFSQEASGLLRDFASVTGHLLKTVRAVDHRHERPSSSRLASLSVRETEVATLAARGVANTEIAIALGISTGTVKSHLHRSFQKLGVDSRTRLALLVSHERRSTGGGLH